MPFLKKLLGINDLNQARISLRSPGRLEDVPNA